MLKKTKVLVDVYRVATASVNGGLRYALTDTFKGKVGVWVEDTSGGTATMVKINDFTDMTAGQKITEETYQKLAQDAARQIQSGKVTQKVKTLSVGKEISGMSNKAEQMETGLYLLVARTDDKDYWWERERTCDRENEPGQLCPQ